MLPQEGMYDFEPDTGFDDTGSFFGSIAKGLGKAAGAVGKAASSVTKVALAPANLVVKGLSHVPVLGGVVNAVHGLATMPIRASQQILEGGNISKVAVANLKSALNNVKTVGPWAQTVLSLVPGIGTGLSAGIGAGLALAEGKPISEAMLAAVKGAMPGGPAAQSAFSVAQGALQGKPIDQIAIGALPLSPQAKSLLIQGLNAAKDIAKGKNVSKSLLDNAIKSLPPQYAKAVQVGVAMGHAKNIQDALKTGAKGAASYAVQKVGGQVMNRVRPGIPNINLSRPKGVISAFSPQLKNAINTLKKNPTLAGQNLSVLAGRMGTTQQTALQALRHVATQRLLPWRSLSPHSAAFVRKWSPNSPMRALSHFGHNTAGLDEAGTHYIVAKGDSPFSIAQKLTGNGNNWTQLKALNKDKKPTIDKNVWVGEVLNIPESWQKPVAKTAATAPVAVLNQPTTTAPATITTPAPVFSVAPGTLQAKSILIAWSKTDGINEAGAPNYGNDAVDLSTDFGPRDKLELMAFQNWDNKTGNAGLKVDGILGPKSLAELQHWSETRAQRALPAASIPGIMTLPEVVIEASAPAKSPLPAVTAPAPLPAPVAVIPALQLPAPVAVSVPQAPVPVVAPPQKPATPASVAAASPKGSSLGPMAAGAAAGALMFGLPGAIIGGIAGAAMS